MLFQYRGTIWQFWENLTVVRHLKTLVCQPPGNPAVHRVVERVPRLCICKVFRDTLLENKANGRYRTHSR